MTGPSGSDCHNDAQCGDDVCARNNECLPRSSLRSVTVKWTMNGVAADSSSCGAYLADSSNLYLQFDSTDYGDTLRFAPVSCRQGTFFVDKLPKRYVKVELGVEGGAGEVHMLDGSSQIQFNLFE